MPKSTASSNDVLKANLKGVDPSWRANANRYLSLHTANPGAGGSQTTSEATYTGYARVAVPLADWTDGGTTFSNTNLIQFGLCTAGSDTITYIVIGTASSGAGQILYSGALGASRSISAGYQPQLAASALTVQEQ